MKIDRTKYAEAYQFGQKVYAKTTRLMDAKKHLVALGINGNSAMDYVYGLRQMLNGHRYERTLSTEATDDFLKWIKRDYGEQKYRSAIAALRQHIEYYQSLTKSPMRGLRAVLQKHSEQLKEQDEYFVWPEDLSKSEGYDEGATKTIVVNVFERNAKARKACLEFHGHVCSVCGFDFEKTYGAIGKGFIHVHHLLDLALIGKAYKVDPKNDLRPVCPNCHAMLHKSKPAYSVEEMKKLISAQ